MSANELATNHRKRAGEGVLKPNFGQGKTELANPVAHLYDERAEAALLGAVLHKPALFLDVSRIIQASDFYILWHGFVWWAFEQLDAGNKKIDVLTVDQQLQTKGVSDAMRLASLTTAAPQVDHAVTYAQSVRDLAMMRRVYVATDEMRKLLLDPATVTFPEMVVDHCNTLLFEATEQQPLVKNHISEASTALLDDVEAAMERKTPMGLLTGWSRLDGRTKGFQPGELIVVGGSEGMGKTTWMLSMIMRMLGNGLGVVLFSLEMTRRETLQALAAMLSGVPRGALKSGVLTGEQHGKLLVALSQVQRLPLYVVDKEEHPDLNPLQHRRVTARFQRQTEIHASFIDGLWLMEATPRASRQREEKNRVRDVHNITRDLITNGDSLRLPTILMHQYRAEFHTRMMARSRKHTTPVLLDFAESSSVRRNAQVVIALNRPGMFADPSMQSLTSNNMYAYILKDRNNGLVASAEYTQYHYDMQHSMYIEV